MKVTVNIVRVIVGLLFIFSGLIKANDPTGLSYKMQEFFEIWNTGLSSGSFFIKGILISLFDFLHDHTLFLSLVMIAFEIIAGAALLLGWRMKLFIWLLLLLILFFTFLTGYAYFSDKFKNCGCFGDCIPITPQTSFLKDIALTVFILFLFWQRKKINPFFSGKANLITMLAVTAFSFGIQWYMLNYLPVMDCLPFKKGNNISQQMQKPADAIDPITVISFVYEKKGKEVEFTADSFPDDFNDSLYHFKKRYDKVIREGKNNEAPIKSFVLTGADQSFDSAAIVLAQPYAILLISEDPSETIAGWEKAFTDLYEEARQKNIPAYSITSVRDRAINAFSKTPFKDIQILSCDNVTIRSAARTNPCVYIIQKGTITHKESYKRINKLSKVLRSIVVQPALPTQHNPPHIDTTKYE